jgi:hypothetical protein
MRVRWASSAVIAARNCIKFDSGMQLSDILSSDRDTGAARDVMSEVPCELTRGRRGAGACAFVKNF